MAKFITIPVKCNTNESFELLTERDEKLKEDKKQVDSMGMDSHSIEIIKEYENKLKDTFEYREIDLNVDLIVGFNKDIENEKQTIIKTVQECITTSITVIDLRKLIKES